MMMLDEILIRCKNIAYAFNQSPIDVYQTYSKYIQKPYNNKLLEQDRQQHSIHTTYRYYRMHLPGEK